MASQKQTEANRRNSRKSTGAKTPQGKAVVSQNAVRYGLLSSTVYMDEGEEADLARLRVDFLAHFQPVGPLEGLLVDRMVSNTWRLRRILKVEALYHRDRMDAFMRPLDASEELFRDRYPYPLEAILKQSTLLTRYESFLERSLHKSLHELQRLQAARAGVPIPLPVAVDVEVSRVEPRANA
jgi:hypothetical protein